LITSEHSSIKKPQTRPYVPATERRHVVVGLSVIIILFIFAGGYSLVNINKLGGLAATIYRHPLEVSNAALKANIAVTKMHRSMKDVVLMLADEHMPFVSVVQLVDEEEQKVFQNLNIIKDKILGIEGQQLEKKTRALFLKWKPIREEVISLVKKNELKKAALITKGKGARHMAEVDRSMILLTSYARGKADGFITQTMAVKNHVTKITVVLVISGSILSLLIAFAVIRRLKEVDIIHHKAAEVVAVSERKYRSLVEHSALGVYAIHGEKLIYVNNRFCDIFGYSAEELLAGMGLKDLIIKEDRKLVREKIQQRLSGEKNVTRYTARGKHKDGSIIWLEIHGGQGELEGETTASGTLLDISERILSQQKIKEQGDLLEDMSRIGKIGGWEFDALSGEGTWTKETAIIHDLDHEAPTNKEIGLDQFQGESRREIDKAVQMAIEQGTPYDLELDIVTDKGNHKWVRTIGIPEKHGKKVVKVRGILQDITERVKTEEELRKHHDHLEDLVEERTADLQKVINAMSGREVRMAELKKENKKLQSQLEQSGFEPTKSTLEEDESNEA